MILKETNMVTKLSEIHVPTHSTFNVLFTTSMPISPLFTGSIISEIPEYFFVQSKRLNPL